MANFLELTNHVNLILGTQGTILDVTSPTYYQASLTNAVNDGYLELQLYRNNWKWMRDVATFDMVVGQTEYVPTSALVVSSLNFGEWKTDMILYEKRPITQISYDEGTKRDYNNQDSTAPSVFAIDPVTKALLFPKPDDTYEIEAHYYIEPEQLVNNVDVPVLPVRWHNLIVYKAVEKVALFIGDQAKYARYNQAYNKMLGQMMRSENPKISFRPNPIV